MALNNKKQFILPPQVVGKADINNLLHEIELLESELLKLKGQASLSASQKSTLLRVTDELAQTAAVNDYDLKKASDRQKFTKTLIDIRDQAPLLHISFAAESSPKVTQAILAWLRGNVHRYALLHIGLQPAIAAGCVLRTPNKIFDLSLRASFEKRQPYLVELIKGAALDQTVQSAAMEK